ncbi:MAG: glycosyl transferase, partial [Halioglobus sp.]|nr:glycosyl transferase [Halioglobus sp.]
WRGDAADDYGLRATLGTTAAALLVLEPAQGVEEAVRRAEELWRERDAGILA